MGDLDESAKTVKCPICGVAVGEVCVASNMKGLGGSPATAHAHEKRIELASKASARSAK